eukprot:TRINITY_DN28812_c0_g1_i1.p1 TRINITY_DN28812_c0_g1~~TRINITY_DN28812_c0_g1_i1.p1  ORF type:complete len:1034 (+),score=223.43 TRINITY_DN28812_c0_g1_i1:196-3297(+)
MPKIELSKKTWRLTPGYDSDAEEEEEDGDEDDEEGRHEDRDEAPSRVPDSSSDEEDEEDRNRPSPQDVLKQVVWALGEKWTDAPFVNMTPVQPGSKFASLAKLMSTAAATANNTGDVRPPGFRIDRIHAPLVRDTFLHNGFRPTRGEDWAVSWSGPRMRENLYRMMHEFQRVNHFPSSTELTRKDRLWENFQRAAKVMGKEDFDFVPETFVLPGQIKAFRQRYFKTKGEHLWIVKPAASSQGKGIFILRNLIDLPLREPAVVSRYVENPLLIQGLKFDLRIYVLVTSFNPLRAFIYREGLTRFASKPYSTAEEHLADVYRHLTNYSINKSAANFQENQKVQADNYGHKWSLSALTRHLTCVGIDVDLMWTNIMDLITKTLLSVEPVIGQATRDACIHEQTCFELYGFDVLVDENLKPWLLEVNLSPSMQADSPLDRQIKSSVLSDAFNLLGLRQVSQQTITSARLQSRLMYLNKLQAAAAVPERDKKRNSTLGVRQDPMKRSQQELEAESTAEDGKVPEKGEEQQAEAAANEDEEPRVPSTPERRPASSHPKLQQTKHFSRRKPVCLDGLSETHLKMLAHALEEFDRCTNFIRLYPTPETLKRYKPITRMRGPREDYRAQLLSAVLFGKHVPTCSARGGPPGSWTGPLGNALTTYSGSDSISEDGEEAAADDEEEKDEGKNDEQTEETLSWAARVTPVGHSEQLAEEALQTLKVLGSKMGSQLLVMEYLLRVYAGCGQLTPATRKKLQNKEHVAIANIFQAFRKQVSLYLRTTSGGKVKLSQPDEEEGDIIDHLASTSHLAVLRILTDTWGAQHKPAAMLALENNGGKQDKSDLCLARCAPTAFASSASGCRAISALAGLSAADLEWMLRGPSCPLELKCLLEFPSMDAGLEDDTPIADVLRQRMNMCSGAPVGPLSEMEFLLKVNAPNPPPRRPTAPTEELPPLAPRLVRDRLAFSAAQLHKRRGAGPLSPLGHRGSGNATISLAVGGQFPSAGQIGQPYSKSLSQHNLLLGKVKLQRSSNGYHPADTEIEL